MGNGARIIEALQDAVKCASGAPGRYTMTFFGRTLREANHRASTYLAEVGGMEITSATREGALGWVTTIYFEVADTATAMQERKSTDE